MIICILKIMVRVKNIKMMYEYLMNKLMKVWFIKRISNWVLRYVKSRYISIENVIVCEVKVIGNKLV